MMPTESRGAAEAISFHNGGGFLDLGRGFLNLALQTRILMPIPSIADADFSIWRSEGDLLPCRVGADSREESGGERDDHRRTELRKGITGATAAATPCLAGGIAGAAGAAAGTPCVGRGSWGLRQERHAWEGYRGLAGAAAGMPCVGRVSRGLRQCGRDAGRGRGVGCGLDALDAVERAP
jgi:hypothetical protein